MINFIDLSTQQKRIKSNLDKRLASVFKSCKFIMGPEVQELEERLADYVGVKYAIGLSSGTDALLIALMGLGISPGDEVIVPDFSFFATAEVVEFLGAKAVFADVDSKLVISTLESWRRK